jgi:hypothetical protein
MSIMKADETGASVHADADWLEVEANPEQAFTPTGSENEPPSRQGNSENTPVRRERQELYKALCIFICENKGFLDSNIGQCRLQAQDASMEKMLVNCQD